MNNQDNTSLPPLQDDNSQPTPDGTSGQRSATDKPLDSIGLSSPQTTTSIDIPQEAGDVDLIEKQWVVKAKQIVEQTNEDPHRQQQEIAKMKTEYIKKRYKRDIQL